MTARSLASGDSFLYVLITDVVTLLPGTSSTESKTDGCGPRAALEEKDREDNTKRQTETGADEHRGEAAVPLRRAVSCCSCDM